MGCIICNLSLHTSILAYTTVIKTYLLVKITQGQNIFHFIQKIKLSSIYGTIVVFTKTFSETLTTFYLYCIYQIALAVFLISLLNYIPSLKCVVDKFQFI